MLIIESNFTFYNAFSHLFSNKKNGISPLLVKKKGSSDISRLREEEPNFPLKISSSKVLVQSAVGVFALGFIDSGYSGDWSRIGVISRETEDLLKAAAFFVVPLCFFLIFFLSRKDEE